MNSADLRDINLSLIRKAVLECFLESGINLTTYEIIAKRAGLTTRTIRRYFPNKNALIIDTIENAGYDYLKNYIAQIIANIPKNLNGLEQLISCLHNVLNMTEKNPTDLLTLMELKMYLYENKLSGDVLQRYVEEVHGSRVHLKNMLLKGIKDGSIRPDINADDTVILLSNTFFGMLQRMEAVRYTDVNYCLVSVRHEAEFYIKNAILLLKNN